MWLIIALFSNIPLLLIGWILMSIGYFLVLKKAGLKKWTAVVPFLAERELSTVLFKKIRTFYRSFAIAAILMLGAIYLGPKESKGWMFTNIAAIVYELFLIRFYVRLSKAFGKKKFFTLLLVLFPVVFLPVLGLGKATFTRPDLGPVKQHGKVVGFLLKAGLVVVSVLEIGIFGFIVVKQTVSTTPPSLLIYKQLDEISSALSGIEGNSDVIKREDYLDSARIKEFDPSREHFYTDYSDAQNVVVLTYVIGSNLEDKGGLASLNLRQIKESTKQGDGVTFVLQAGGCGRWFTKGIKNETVARYEIKGGNLTMVEDVPDDTCMSWEEALSDFLTWAKEKYPADRYMLVFWDHGGGVFMGYGQDDLNKRQEGNGTMPVSELVSAIDSSGIKFDLIGFDACLMQDIEIAAALEPYTDYYLASEEVEGGCGWYYVSPFGKLAKDPTMPTEALATDIISCFDQLNTVVADGKTDTRSTLSLIDTSLAKPANAKLGDLFAKADDAVKNSKKDFADVAVAANDAYAFSSDFQIDLIDFLSNLKEADYDNTIAADEDIDEVIDSVRDSILYRNKNSADGINGEAFAFPYKFTFAYTDTRKQLVALGNENEYRLYDDAFSIMAAQKKKAMESDEYVSNALLETLLSSSSTMEMLNNMVLKMQDNTQEEWYIEGFEDYDNSEALVDIPLSKEGEGYSLELDENIWEIIADCKTNLYQVENAGEMKYLGSSHFGKNDSKGHPMVGVTGNWVYIGGELVSYDAEPVKKTDEGYVYNGRVKAKLAGEDIILYIEWNPVQNEGDLPTEGTIVGYDNSFSEAVGAILDSKGMGKLEAGDTLQFVFDRYTADGELISSTTEGRTVVVPASGSPKVEFKAIEDGDYIIGGVLTDVYQRKMTSEIVDVQ